MVDEGTQYDPLDFEPEEQGEADGAIHPEDEDREKDHWD